MQDFEFQITPPPDRDSKLIPILVIASLVMVAVCAAVYMLNPRKGMETTVEKVDLYAPHTEFKAAPGGDQGGGNQIVGAPDTFEDDLYVVATLRMTDKLRRPIFLDSYTATMVTAEGATVEATIISPSYLPRLETTFPQILPLVSLPAAQPIGFDETLKPGATQTGSIVLLFPQISAKAWQTKKSATVTFNLGNLGGDTLPQTVVLP